MGFQKMSKEEFLWWKEDNKGKFYGLCAGGAVALIVLIFGIVTLLKPAPVEEVVEEDVVTEIEVGNFDFDEAIEEQQLSEEEKRTQIFGTFFTISPYSLVRDEERYGSFIEVKAEDEKLKVYLPFEEEESGLGSLTDDDWFNIFLDKDTYTMRGSFKEIDASIVEKWLENDYRKVVLSLSDPEVDATLAKEWSKHVEELKVEKGYKKNTKQENIADDDWDAIQKETYDWFEEYLQSIDEEYNLIPVPEPEPEEEEGEEAAEAEGNEAETKVESSSEANSNASEKADEETVEETEETEEIEEEIPYIPNFLEVYLENNPLPSYEGIMVVDKAPYLCRKNGVPYGRMNEEIFNSYRDTYWEIFFSNAKDELLNNDDVFSEESKGYAEGIFYRMTKPVEATLQHSYRDRESIVMIRKLDGTKEFYYFPNVIWTTEGNDEETGEYLEHYYDVPITKDTECFAYFMIGETYIVSGSKQHAFPVLEDPLFKGLNEDDYMVFDVNDTICYKRSDVYGSTASVNLSSFVLEDGPYEIPEGVVYLKNDTKYVITLREENLNTEYSDFQPEDEIFLDRNYINLISWRVE